MFDSCRRDIHYLRLSVTDRCNLCCRYCMPDGAKIPEHEEVLTHDEFLRLAALFAQCGIDTVRATGGEPLVRKSVAQLVAGLKATPGSRQVSMTTNGTLLAQQLPALLDAGLDSVNISLDTLDPAVCRHITARDEFAAVQAGLRATQEKVADSLPGLAPDRLAVINAAIQQLCAERGCYYLDLSAEFADDAGYLSTEFSQPDGVHLTVSGYSRWVSYLCTHVPYSKDNPYQAGSTYYLSEDMKGLLSDLP